MAVVSHPGFGAAAVVVLAAFFVLESRLRHPMMPLGVMRAPGLLTSSLVRGLMVIGMYSTFFIGVLYFQHVLASIPSSPAWHSCPRRSWWL